MPSVRVFLLHKISKEKPRPEVFTETIIIILFVLIGYEVIIANKAGSAKFACDQAPQLGLKSEKEHGEKKKWAISKLLFVSISK